MSVDIQKYCDLFIHRYDVYAEQQSSGQYYPVRQPITDGDVLEHLAGFVSYGVYVIEPTDNTVKYIVFDLDTHDEAQTSALKYLVEKLIKFHPRDEGQLDRDCLLLERSGNKGVHVWLFLDAPLPARQVRAWVERDFFPGWRALGYRDLEVFPKQDTVDEGGYGNLVKLPLGVHAVSGNKSEFIVAQGWATGVNDVVALPAGLVPQVPSSESATPDGVAGPSRVPVVGTDGPRTPFPCIDLALYGPVGSGYRDRMIHRLALYLYGHGMAEDLAEEQCLRANENYDPPLPERDVRAKVKSAYRGRQRGAGCNTQSWLADICPGPCDQAGFSSAPASALFRAQAGSTVSVDVLERNYLDGKVRLKLSHPDADNNPTLVVTPQND